MDAPKDNKSQREIRIEKCSGDILVTIPAQKIKYIRVIKDSDEFTLVTEIQGDFTFYSKERSRILTEIEIEKDAARI